MAEILASLKKKGGGTDFVLTVTYGEDYYGATITATDGTITLSDTATSSGELEFTVPNEGTWTVSTTVSGSTISQDVTIDNEFTTELPSLVPQGLTVTPINDIQIWLRCANIKDKNYTTLAEVLDDRDTFETLLRDSNACDYMARSTEWAVAIGKVPTMTSNTTPSGECIGQNYVDDNYYLSFNGSTSISDSAGAVTNQVNGFAVGYHFDEPIRLYRVKYWNRETTPTYGVADHKYQGSNDGINWIDLTNTLIMNNPNSTIPCEEIVDSEIAYSYIRLYVINAWNNTSTTNKQTTYCNVSELQFYEADITHNQDAMALIGKYDYCSNALLNNTTWTNAIANSDYFEEVLNVKVPVMTDNTHPSGEVITNSFNSSYPSWQAFDSTLNTTFWASITGITTNVYLGYKFDNPVNISCVGIINASYNTGGSYNQGVKNFDVKYSDDGTNWSDAVYTGVATKATSTTQGWEYFGFASSGAHKYWIVFCKDNYGDTYNVVISQLQFYGRASKEVLVPLVPTMTSNTTPSGECYANSCNGTIQAYYAYDRVANTGWHSVINVTNAYNCYDFGSAINIKDFSMDIGGNVTGNVTFDVIGSNDRENWTTLSIDTVSITNGSTTTHNGSFSNENNYRYYGVRFGTAMYAGSSWFAVYELQFYKKTVQTNIIHSAANDTIYYYSDNSPVVIATTNSEGNGICDFSQLEDGIYTLYSTVAKNPNDLTLDYTKRIRITKSVYGGTTELYMFPDTVSTLYWYGYMSDDAEIISAANGWTTTSRTPVNPTFNINSLTITTSSGQVSGIGTKNTIEPSMVSAICKSTNDYVCVGANTAKSHATTQGVETNSSSIVRINKRITLGKCYSLIKGENTQCGIYNVFLYDKILSATPTYTSAANDTLYILIGGSRIWLTNTNGEGKSYDPLLPPGTYTIYSSIAKDPNNLSNDYSKVVTVTSETRTINVMPDNTLYWYGYDAGLTEDCVSANGWSWSGVGLGTPTHNTNDITLSSSMEGVKSIINGTHNVVVEGVTIVAGTYGLIGATPSKAVSGSDWTEFSTSGKLLLSKAVSNKYCIISAVNGRSLKIHAWWYE